jgi:hypothetical protein
MASKNKTTGTGNASNPSPEQSSQPDEQTNQYLNKKAEKYLRESANIEDLPDAEDQKEADEAIEKNNPSASPGIKE